MRRTNKGFNNKGFVIRMPYASTLLPPTPPTHTAPPPPPPPHAHTRTTRTCTRAPSASAERAQSGALSSACHSVADFRRAHVCRVHSRATATQVHGRKGVVVGGPRPLVRPRPKRAPAIHPFAQAGAHARALRPAEALARTVMHGGGTVQKCGTLRGPRHGKGGGGWRIQRARASRRSAGTSLPPASASGGTTPRNGSSGRPVRPHVPPPVPDAASAAASARALLTPRPHHCAL